MTTSTAYLNEATSPELGFQLSPWARTWLDRFPHPAQSRNLRARLSGSGDLDSLGIGDDHPSLHPIPGASTCHVILSSPEGGRSVPLTRACMQIPIAQASSKLSITVTPQALTASPPVLTQNHQNLDGESPAGGSNFLS
ncbi:hypothetical protein RRG08_024710 [Elysia crispata]|uniref:Uncharacterized protein n=1 Tax=Elysia crispata TaxID=231223 RepID=A0AAE0YF47_9GAST|nr:hypothetical protein RRG08_024710 [Elysia crispata]